MNDQIADLLTRIRNAYLVGKQEVTVPASKLKAVILTILKNEGFVSDFTEKAVGNQNQITLYFSPNKKLSHLRQISKPGQRIYVKSKEIPRPLRGMGLIIVSTPSGVVTGKEARKRGLGGELICEVW